MHFVVLCCNEGDIQIWRSFLKCFELCEALIRLVLAIRQAPLSYCQERGDAARDAPVTARNVNEVLVSIKLYVPTGKS